MTLESLVTSFFFFKGVRSRSKLSAPSADITFAVTCQNSLQRRHFCLLSFANAEKHLVGVSNQTYETADRDEVRLTCASKAFASPATHPSPERKVPSGADRDPCGSHGSGRTDSSLRSLRDRCLEEKRKKKKEKKSCQLHFLRNKSESTGY